MTRGERDAALAAAAERYCALTRLQRARVILDDMAGAVALEAKLNEAMRGIEALVDVLIEPDPQGLIAADIYGVAQVKE